MNLAIVLKIGTGLAFVVLGVLWIISAIKR